jgi:hypothetical protein
MATGLNFPLGAVCINIVTFFLSDEALYSVVYMTIYDKKELYAKTARLLCLGTVKTAQNGIVVAGPWKWPATGMSEQ